MPSPASLWPIVASPPRAPSIAACATALVALTLAPLMSSCGRAADPTEQQSRAFASPQRVTIAGYDGITMEPFLSRDGRYLLFNDSNAPDNNTDLHCAERIDDLHFRYVGRLTGANSHALDGVASLDGEGWLYFVSVRDYATRLSTLYRARFAQCKATEAALLPGVSRMEAGIVNFDAEISADGKELYFVDGRFTGGAMPKTADLVIAERGGDGFARRADSARILREINTPALEYAPALSADGKTLLFTRIQRPGIFANAEIFIARRQETDAAFGPPQRLAALKGFVEAATFAPDGRAIYYHKREGSRFVLYRASAPATVDSGD